MLFFAVIAVVLVKVVLLATGHAEFLGPPLGLGATVVPALAATVIGVRAYVELELLAGQSRRMKAAMERGRRRIERLDLERPVASQDLGAEVLTVATPTLEDIDGWARLFPSLSGQTSLSHPRFQRGG